MRFLLDSDALIKLNRAGILQITLEELDCVTTRAVYEEVVTKGHTHGHADSSDIGRSLTGACEVLDIAPARDVPTSFGDGESSLLTLARQSGDVTIVSDDRRFVSLLDALQFAYFTSADVLVLLAQTDVITMERAREALEILQPSIQAGLYDQAFREIALLQGD